MGDRLGSYHEVTSRIRPWHPGFAANLDSQSVTSLDLARWQFGITTVYHFLFVPLTIGLATFVAYYQTRWYRTGEEQWLRATKFWGKLLLISFALGVVTGIVQEFQFGMNWSNYSRFVGDIFGAPLAMEGLAAFFVESTFLGLWIFGWGKLSKRVHLFCIWAVAASTALSAFFILAANSWMQHPVGYTMVDGKPELDSIFAVLGNNTAIYAFVHTLLAALITASMVVIAISAWHVLRGNETGVFGRSLRGALPVLAVAAIVTVIVGHFNGVLMTEQQPMKMAAADAVFETTDGAGPVAVRHRRPQVQPRGPEPQHRDPQPPLVHLDGLPPGRDPGHQRPQRRVPGEVRAGRVRARWSRSPTGPGA